MNICAIAKNESLYVREWILFHEIVGVDHFTIYNNNSTDSMVEVLQPFVDRGLVDLVDWPMPNPSQPPAYQHYIHSHRGPWWTAFLDCDEFLWSPAFATIEEALNTLPRSAVGVNWLVFGSSGQVEYSPEPVIQRFTGRPFSSHPVNQHIKSVIWMDQNVLIGSDPHFFQVQHGTVNEKAYPVSGPFSQHSSDLLRINHYSTKSLAEWRKRILLGKPDRAGVEVREQEWYWDRQQQEVDDREIWRYLPALKERL